MTQEGLGRAAGLDRTAITRLEKGERKLNVPELVVIAETLGRPLSYFVSKSVPAVVSRRRDTVHSHPTTRALDVELDQFTADLQMLVRLDVVSSVERRVGARTPRTHAEAERLAASARSDAGMGAEPIDDLGRVVERLGLYTFSASLGESGPDGGCAELDGSLQSLGAAVINGDAPPGRRRMTLAHELGHWLSGDAYDLEASTDSEKMVNSFAIHFLAPRAGVNEAWEKHSSWPPRDRALAVSALFKLSWSAAVAQLKNLNLIDFEVHRMLAADEPRSGDYLRLGLAWSTELECPYVSPGFAAACLRGYVSGRLTSSRVVELLRGTLDADDLPRQDDVTRDDLRKSFAGHDD